MHVKYTNTIEDGIKWQWHHDKNSPSMQRTYFFHRIMFSLGLFIFLAIVGYERNEVRPVVIGLIAAMIYFFYFPRITRKLTEKQAKKMYKEGQNKGFLCEHKLEISENFLIEKTDQGEQSNVFSSIERISLTDEYAFIYIGSANAYIVPLKRVSEGDFYEFIKQLKLKCNL